jgi:hypothetical protein
MQALTTYINDDPAAHAWLDGQPDQWGMVVNPAYKGIALPVNQWPLLSTFEPKNYYQSDLNDCLFNDPVPYPPLISAPLASLEVISKSMQFAEPNSTTLCDQPNPGEILGEKLTTGGQQPPGSRFVIGVTPLADNARYLLGSAALQTTGGTYVAPSNASLQATAALLAPDPATDTWPIPYAAFQTSAGARAYPGTMVVYAAVATSGLPAADAQDYAAFLQFASTTGQTPGVGVGELPAGYVPLTQANGLGALAAYTQAAALDVAAQNGQIPPLPGQSGASGSAATPGGSNATSGPGGSSAANPFGSTLELPNVPFSTSGLFSETALDVRANRLAHGSPRAASVQMVSSNLDPATALWTSGFPIAMIFGLGALGALFVPLTYRLGRRRGRW